MTTHNSILVHINLKGIRLKLIKTSVFLYFVFEELSECLHSYVIGINLC